MSIESLTFAVNRRQFLTKNNLANKKSIFLELEIVLLKKLSLRIAISSYRKGGKKLKESIHLIRKKIIRESEGVHF